MGFYQMVPPSKMIEKYYKIFRCPDDFSKLLYRKDFLECQNCKKQFFIFDDNLIEILPRDLPKWNLKDGENKKSERDYYEICNEKFILEKKENGWGFLPLQSPGFRAFIKKERKKIKDLIPPYLKNKIMIDVSGGSGNFSLYLASFAETLFHCEAHVLSLLTAKEWARDLGLNNVVFVRANYLKLPFLDNSFDVAICTDTLERGENHEIQLIKEIYRILRKDGLGICDFHALRPFAKKRNLYISFYTKKEIEKLFEKANIKNFKIYPFGHFPTSLAPSELGYFILDEIFGFLPPIRYIITIVK